MANTMNRPSAYVNGSGAVQFFYVTTHNLGIPILPNFEVMQRLNETMIGQVVQVDERTNMNSITIKLKDVASLIGVSRQTVYRLAKTDRNFPRPRQVNKAYLFVKAEVDAYIKAKFGVEVTNHG